MFNDHRQTKTVQRQALYEQVWAQLMTKVAKEYGISNVALAKICKKLNVPCPWRGYWRRRETGKSVKPLLLPPNSDPTKQVATIHRTIRPDAVVQISEDALQRIDTEQAAEQKIEVPDRLTSPHHLLKVHLEEWRSAKVDDYGAIWSGDIRRLNIRVSPKSLARALRVMDTLFKALEARGHQVGVQEGYQRSLGVRIDGEPIEFGLEEKFQRLDHPSQRNPRLEWWQRQRYQYAPTGSLTLKIVAWGVDGLRKSWSDGKTAKLETCLNDFIVGLLKVAEVVKARRLKQEQEEQLRREAERRHQEEAQKRQEELARRQALEQEATNWAKAQQLRAYLEALKDRLITKHGEIESGSQADRWLTWAHQHANRLDPLRNE